MEVTLGPFDNAAEACDYCFSSFTKEGNPPSAAKYVAEKDGCRCKAKDMEAMGKTTCEKI